MKLNLYVLTPKRIIWDCEVKEIILSTNSGQIGVLPNHAPINTAVDKMISFTSQSQIIRLGVST